MLAMVLALVRSAGANEVCTPLTYMAGALYAAEAGNNGAAIEGLRGKLAEACAASRCGCEMLYARNGESGLAEIDLFKRDLRTHMRSCATAQNCGAEALAGKAMFLAVVQVACKISKLRECIVVQRLTGQ